MLRATLVMPVLAALAVYTVVLVPGARADYEGAVKGVEDFPDECGIPDLSYQVDNAIAFWYGLQDLGSPYDYACMFGDEDVYAKDFADTHTYAWGNDDVTCTGTDWADVVFYSGRGTYSCTSDETNIWMGDSANTCVIRTSANNSSTPAHTRFANGGAAEDANMMILFAPHNSQWCVLDGGTNTYDVDQGGSGNQFVSRFSFHGSPPSESSGDDDDLYDWVIGSESDDIGDDYLDWFGHTPGGSNNDTCPISSGMADNWSEFEDMFLNGGFKDYKDTGTHDGQWYVFLSCCDPNAGEVLPGC